MNVKIVPLRDDAELTPCSTTRPSAQRTDDRLAQTSKTMRGMLEALG